MAKEIYRVGKISSINYPAGTVRVTYPDKDDSVTQEIPLLAFEYNMPQVGDQIMVLHLSNGTEAGLVLGRYWNTKNKPPEGFKGLYRKDLDRTPGRAMIRYDANSGSLRIVMPDTTLECPTVLVDGDVTITGDLRVTGSIVCGQNITASVDVIGGGVSLKKHTHTDSIGGATTPPK